MRALTTVPMTPDSLAVVDVPDPVRHEGDLLVDAIAVGVCGTDREIARGEYGWAPPGHDRLVHRPRVLRPGPRGARRLRVPAGDLVVGVVRRPDPEPCGACAHGEFDMCRNGRYTERGIKQIDGYASEQWTVEADYAVQLDAPARGRRRADGADDRRGQGLGAGRADRRAGVVRAERVLVTGGRPDRPARRPARARSAGSTCTSSTA